MLQLGVIPTEIRFLIQCAALAVMLLGGTRAQAGEADELVKQGVEARRKGRDQEAMELFKRANAIDSAPRTLAQLGFAEQALGVWADAETHLRTALSSGGDPWIKKNQAAIRKSLDTVAAHLGSLEIWGKPEGAQVVVNGAVAGTLPLSEPLRVTAGTLSVAVRADGYVELTRMVEISAGATARERFDLPRRIVTTVAAQPGAHERRPAAALVRAPDEPAGAADEGSPVWKRWWFWTVIGAVAVAGGATAYVLTRPRDDCPAGQICSSL